MQLTVQPFALRVAGDDLGRHSGGLAQALAEFCGTAQRCAPGVGRPAYDAVAATARAAAQAGEVLTSDLRQLAGAVQQLAAGYAELDRRLVPGSRLR